MGRDKKKVRRIHEEEIPNQLSPAVLFHATPLKPSTIFECSSRAAKTKLILFTWDIKRFATKIKSCNLNYIYFCETVRANLYISLSLCSCMWNDPEIDFIASRAFNLTSSTTTAIAATAQATSSSTHYVNSGRDSVILILTHFWQFQSTEHGFELLLMSIRSRFVVLLPLSLYLYLTHKM